MKRYIFVALLSLAASLAASGGLAESCIGEKTCRECPQILEARDATRVFCRSGEQGREEVLDLDAIHDQNEAVRIVPGSIVGCEPAECRLTVGTGSGFEYPAGVRPIEVLPVRAGSALEIVLNDWARIGGRERTGLPAFWPVKGARIAPSHLVFVWDPSELGTNLRVEAKPVRLEEPERLVSLKSETGVAESQPLRDAFDEWREYGAKKVRLTVKSAEGRTVFEQQEYRLMSASREARTTKAVASVRDENRALAHAARAALLSGSGSHGAALVELRNAHELEPKNTWILRWLAALTRKCGLEARADALEAQAGH